MSEETAISTADKQFPSLFSSRVFRYGLLVCFLLPILLHANNTRFSRFVADDYCHAEVVEQEGVFESVTYWYDTWTGNYASSLLQGIYVGAGKSALNIMLFAFIILWWIAVVWLVIEVCLRLKLTHISYIGPLMGSVLVFGTIEGMPNVYDTIYWAAGAISHVTPLILVCYYLAFLMFIQRRRVGSTARLIIIILIIPITLLIAGFSPASTAHFITLLIIVILYNIRFSSNITKRTLIPILLFTLATALIALYVINTAPGTDIRAARFESTPAPGEFIVLTISYTAAFIAAAFAILAPFTALLIVLLSGLIAYYFQPNYTPYFYRNRWKLLAVFLVICLALIAAPFSTGAYGMSTYLPARANTTPLLTLMMMMAAAGYILGMSERARPFTPRPARLVLFLFGALIVLSPILEIAQAIQISRELSTFAHEWDTSDEQIIAARERGETDITIPAFSFDLGDIAVGNAFDDNPQTGVNGCAAEYYGVDTIQTPFHSDDS